jgi:hypothetical protein
VRDRYVILTGAKNNAGDFLIKYRAKQLFGALRPDREIIDYDAWKPLTNEQLEVVNESRALILTGGPALQFNMSPAIYPLRKNLDEIHVPILTMAIGWKSKIGTWESTCKYPLSECTLQLLRKVEKSGYRSSVRDYHTQEVLNSHGFDSFDMTGCAALYSFEHIGKGLDFDRPIRRVSFSLGVNFYKSPKLKLANRKLILGLCDLFPQAELTVVFHHSTDPEVYRKTHNPNLELSKAQHELIAWLEQQQVRYVDISGSAESMIEHYSGCDLHIGYRVHAHIFMASIGRLTALIAEDGRGTALNEVIGGLAFNDCPRIPHRFYEKILARFGRFDISNQLVDGLPDRVLLAVKKELQAGCNLFSQNRSKIWGGAGFLGH